MIYPRIFAGYQPLSRRLWHIWEHIAAAAAEVYPTMRKIVGGPQTPEGSTIMGQYRWQHASLAITDRIVLPSRVDIDLAARGLLEM